MNQIRSVLVALASAAVITGAAGCGTSSTPHPTTSNARSVQSTTTTSAPAPNAQPGCVDLGGTVAADQTCHVKSSASNYKLDMSLPLDYADQQAVTDLLTQERDGFLDWMRDFGPQQRRDQPYKLVVTTKTYRSGTPTAGTQSLVFKISQDTGAAHEGHPDTTFNALNYDLTKRAQSRSTRCSNRAPIRWRCLIRLSCASWCTGRTTGLMTSTYATTRISRSPTTQ